MRGAQKSGIERSSGAALSGVSVATPPTRSAEVRRSDAARASAAPFFDISRSFGSGIVDLVVREVRALAILERAVQPMGLRVLHQALARDRAVLRAHLGDL